MADLQVVLTHGRDKPFEIPDTLQREWTDALRFGLRRVDAADAETVPVSFAFYGDLWRPDAAAAATRDFAAPDPAAEALAAAAAADMAAAAGLPVPAPEAGTRDLADALSGPLAALDAHFHVGEFVLRQFLGDLSQYYTEPDLRVATQDRVADTVLAAGGPVILIAHSMGTIVSYDLLVRRPELPVQALITCGSPLGLPSFHHYAVEAGGVAPFPSALPTWVNVYSRSDFATTVRQLAPLFPAPDARHVDDVEAIGRKSGVTDLIAGHDPIVYLSSAALAGAVRDLLAGEPLPAAPAP